MHDFPDFRPTHPVCTNFDVIMAKHIGISKALDPPPFGVYVLNKRPLWIGKLQSVTFSVCSLSGFTVVARSLLLEGFYQQLVHEPEVIASQPEVHHQRTDELLPACAMSQSVKELVSVTVQLHSSIRTCCPWLPIISIFRAYADYASAMLTVQAWTSLLQPCHKHA